MSATALILLIPILALATGLVAVIRMPKSALAPTPKPTPVDADVEARFRGLEQDVAQLRQELTETQERLDFAERMLAREESPRRPLPPANSDPRRA